VERSAPARAADRGEGVHLAMIAAGGGTKEDKKPPGLGPTEGGVTSYMAVSPKAMNQEHTFSVQVSMQPERGGR